MVFPKSLSLSLPTIRRSRLLFQTTPSFSCEGVHGRISLMSLSLPSQQCPACLVGLIWMVLEMGDKWLNSCCFVGCCYRNLFSIARSILVQFLSSFFSIRFVSVLVVYPNSSIDRTTAWRKPGSILSDRPDFLANTPTQAESQQHSCNW